MGSQCRDNGQTSMGYFYFVTIKPAKLLALIQARNESNVKQKQN